jgi:hypothetical protein
LSHVFAFAGKEVLFVFMSLHFTPFVLCGRVTDKATDTHTERFIYIPTRVLLPFILSSPLLFIFLSEGAHAALQDNLRIADTTLTHMHTHIHTQHNTSNTKLLFPPPPLHSTMADSSLWSLLVLILLVIADAVALSKVCRSRRGTLEIILWSLLIVFFPVGGLLIWFLCGPREYGGTAPAGAVTSAV